MGFEPEATQYELKFEDSKLHGLEVTIESLSVGELLEMQELFEQVSGSNGVAATRKLLNGFADSLVSWNLTRKGKPVPANLEGVASQKFDLILKIVQAWMGAIADVPDPSDPSSNGSGSLDLERSIPMAALSPSPSS